MVSRTGPDVEWIGIAPGAAPKGRHPVLRGAIPSSNRYAKSRSDDSKLVWWIPCGLKRCPAHCGNGPLRCADGELLRGRPAPPSVLGNRL